MPEGHVIHRQARALTESFAGKAVRVASPQGRFADAAALLDGTRFERAEAVGKHLFLDFEADRVVWIHLGLIGKLHLGPDEPPANPGTLRLRIAANGVRADLRGPQWCRLVTPEEAAAVVASSGPDPLRADADPERAWARVSRSGRPIGALLMDQAVFAGVGNIYRAEVLFRAGIPPRRRGDRVSAARLERVWDDLVALMGEGVATGLITTVEEEDVPVPLPEGDAEAGRWYVYHRTGRPCLRCGTPGAEADMAGRRLFWCPTCQAR